MKPPGLIVALLCVAWMLMAGGANAATQVCPSPEEVSLGGSCVTSAEALTLIQEEEADPPKLKVHVAAIREEEYANPGESKLEVEGTEGDNASVTITLKGHQIVSEPLEWEFEDIVIPWTCSHTGRVYDYTVIETGSYGVSVSHSGSFHGATAWWCGQVRKDERAAKRRALRKAQEQRESAARAIAEYDHEVALWESNCRKVGGTVVWLNVGTKGAVAPYCRSSSGVLINVPS